MPTYAYQAAAQLAQQVEPATIWYIVYVYSMILSLSLSLTFLCVVNKYFVSLFDLYICPQLRV